MAAVKAKLLCAVLLVVLSPMGTTGNSVCSRIRQRISALPCIKHCGNLLDDCDKCMGEPTCTIQAAARADVCHTHCHMSILSCHSSCHNTFDHCLNDCAEDALQACVAGCSGGGDITEACMVGCAANIDDTCLASCSAQKSVCDNKCDAA